MSSHNTSSSGMRILAIAIAFALTISLSPLLSTVYLQTPAVSTPQVVSELLTNDSVLKMLKDGIASEIIVAKIKASPTSFDTSPSSIQKLKADGVADGVVLAMIESGAKQTTTSPNNSANETVG